LANAQTASEAYRRKFGNSPKNDSLVVSLLRERDDWPYSQYKAASLLIMLSRARAADRRVSLSTRITSLLEALRADGHMALAVKIEKQCSHLIDAPSRSGRGVKTQRGKICV
jgi:hypothetical protein